MALLPLAAVALGADGCSCDGRDRSETTSAAVGDPPNTLPAPNHTIRYGYYYADGRYGDHTAEVNPYTDLYIALPRGYITDLDWRPLFQDSMMKAAANDRIIFLQMDEEFLWDEVLAIAAPYWSRIEMVEVGHETDWSRAETDAKITRLRGRISAHGLGQRPVGIVWSIGQALTYDAVNAAGLDWVGIEAYVDAPGSPNSQDNIDLMNRQVNTAKARVPAGKEIVLVMQAYDRNFNWTNIPTLVDLQIPTYLLAYNDPRVIAIFMFSYARPGGSRDHPELKVPHQMIAEKILGIDISGIPPR